MLLICALAIVMLRSPRPQFGASSGMLLAKHPQDLDNNYTQSIVYVVTCPHSPSTCHNECWQAQIEKSVSNDPECSKQCISFVITPMLTVMPPAVTIVAFL